MFNISSIFMKLNWNNNQKIQEEGIKEGKKIKYLSVFFQPEDKNIWENCARIIVSKSDIELKTYLFKLFEWLQDANWPGYNIILDRLKKMPFDFILSDYENAIDIAFKLGDEMWLYWLNQLIYNNDNYKILDSKYKKILNKNKKNIENN